MKFYRILYYLINNSYKKISQKKISEYADCTQAYVSKKIKKMKKKGIVIKPNKNTVIVQNPLMIAYLLSYFRELPKPFLFRTPDYEDTLKVLKKTTYSITLDSAAKIKKGEKPGKVWTYILGKDMNILYNYFNPTMKNPGIVVFPADKFRFQKQNLVNNTYTVSDWDLVIDYLTIGDNKKAIKKIKEYDLSSV